MLTTRCLAISRNILVGRYSATAPQRDASGLGRDPFDDPVGAAVLRSRDSKDRLSRRGLSRDALDHSVGRRIAVGKAADNYALRCGI